MSQPAPLLPAPEHAAPAVPKAAFNRPSPDIGAIPQFALSAYSGAFQHNLTASVVDTARYMGQRVLDQASGMQPMEREEWQDVYQNDIGPNFHFTPGATANEWELRRKDAEERQQMADRDQGYRYPVTAMAGGLFGSLAGDPMGTAISLIIPESKVASTLSSATRARVALASSRLAEAMRMSAGADRALAVAEASKALSRLGTSASLGGDVAQGVFVDMASGLKSGVVSTAVTEGGTWSLDNGFLGHEYETTDLLYGVLMSGGFSAGVHMLSRTAGGRRAVAADIQHYAGQQVLRDVAGQLPTELAPRIESLDATAATVARGKAIDDVPMLRDHPTYGPLVQLYEELGIEVRVHRPDEPMIPRARQGLQVDGWHDPRQPGVIHLVARGDEVTPNLISTVHHEIVHDYLTRAVISRAVNPELPDLYHELATAVSKTPGFDATVARVRLANGGQGLGRELIEEAVAAHAETAMAHPAFWRELPDRPAKVLMDIVDKVKAALYTIYDRLRGSAVSTPAQLNTVRQALNKIDAAWAAASVEARARGIDMSALAKDRETRRARKAAQQDFRKAILNKDEPPVDQLPTPPEPTDDLLLRQSQDQAASGQFDQLEKAARAFQPWVDHDAQHRQAFCTTSLKEISKYSAELPTGVYDGLLRVADEVRVVINNTRNEVPQGQWQGRVPRWFDSRERELLNEQFEYYSHNPQLLNGRTPMEAAVDHQSIRWTARVIQGIRHCQAVHRAVSQIATGAGMDNKLHAYSFGLSGVLNYGVTAHGTPDISKTVSARRLEVMSSVMNPLHSLIDQYGLKPAWDSGALHARLIDHDRGDVAKAALTPNELDVYHAWRNADDVAISMHNQAGDVMRRLPGHMITTVHNASRIVPAKESWMEYTMAHLDWDRIGQRLNHGKPRSLSDLEKQGFIKNCYGSVTGTGFDMVDPKGVSRPITGFNLLDPDAWKVARGEAWAPEPHEFSQIMFWKDGASAVEYDHLYGSGDFGAAVMSQLNKQLEYGWLRREFGDFELYKKVVYPLIDTASAQSTGVTSLVSPGQVAKASFEMLTELDDPVNTRTAQVGSFFRHATSAAVLGKMAISSACDLAGSASMLRYLGGNGRLFPFITDTIKRMADNKTGREFLMAQSAMYDSLSQNYTRLGMRDGGANNMAKRMSAAMFKWSLMNRFNEALRMTYAEWLSRDLGSLAEQMKAGGPVPEQALHGLALYGITAEDFSSMARHADVVDGLDGVRLAPSMVPDSSLARKLHTYFTDTSNYASVVPSVTDEGLLRLRTHSGTGAGEFVRTAGQYLGMPLAMTTKMRSRLYYGYGQSGTGLLSMNLSRSLPAKTETAMFVGQLVFMGWVSTVIKDTLAGREPLHFMQQEQWTLDNWKRVVDSSGALGLLGVAEDRAGSYDMFGAFPGWVLKSIDVMDKEHPNQSLLLHMEQMMPFRSLPLVPEPLSMWLASCMSETASRQLELQERSRLMNGQSQWIDYTRSPEPTK